MRDGSGSDFDLQSPPKRLKRSAAFHRHPKGEYGHDAPRVTEQNCPHCGALNPGGAAFCESCGKALPNLTPTGPRIVSGNQFATSTVGRELQADELHKTAKKASGALLAVAIITVSGPWCSS